MPSTEIESSTNATNATNAAGPVVLFGASGFIGQALQRRLIDGGYAVAAVVRPQSATSYSSQATPGVEMVAAQLDDRSVLEPLLARASAVIYAAGTVRGNCFEDFLPANVAGVATVTDLLSTRPNTPLLVVSSLVVTRPDISWYAQSKAAGEAVVVQRLEANPQLPWTILRPPAVYGPGDKELLPLLRMVRRGFAPVPGHPDQRLSLLHVDDLSEAVAAWLGNPAPCSGKAFGIDDGHIVGYDWGQIAQSVAPGSHLLVPIPRVLLKVIARINLRLSKVLGYAPMLTPGKARELQAPNWVCDNAEYSAATGWEPRLDLARGAQGLFS